MKAEMTLALGLIVLMGLSSPALAAPKEIEDICFDRAIPKQFNGRGGREQFIANCIADLTPATPQKRNRYKKNRR